MHMIKNTITIISLCIIQSSNYVKAMEHPTIKSLIVAPIICCCCNIITTTCYALYREKDAHTQGQSTQFIIQKQKPKPLDLKIKIQR
jgi:hypothetical protein